ncbi:MAG: histidine phosphatase family protein [Naasia sp.]|uniref:histidine phosphatase family protein n=1 Tax=Naasia sp. TaxID=2546198 RepID=UPI00261D6111|nr:histidine phosphatase family protein [Naasia sp.]MCU1569788.1 histidine phosphatase family protein [Naasia sp.]
MTHLVLVRHGQTDWNLQERIQGSSDIPLNETGREQARAAGRLLADQHWDAIVSSPLSRALETARIIAAEVGLHSVQTVDDLRERHYGAAEGLTGAEVEARFDGGRQVTGRESRDAVIERVRPALIDIAEEHPGQSVLVVSHGGVIGSLVRDATDYAWPEAGQPIPNGSAHRFRYRDGVLGLVEFNGTPWAVPTLDARSDAPTR